MTVHFEIPNGKMVVTIDTFMREANLKEIRKALKLMTVEQRAEVVTWIKHQVIVIDEKAPAYLKQPTAENEKAMRLKNRYEKLIANYDVPSLSERLAYTE